MNELLELLGQELYDKVVAVSGDKKVDVVTNRYIPRDKFNELNEEKKTLEATVVERDKQLKNLKADSEASETLKEKITKLETDNAELAKQHAEELTRVKQTNAVRLAIADQANNPDTLLKLIDLSAIKLTEDGKLSGLDDQLKTLKESDGYLFKTTEAPDGKDQQKTPPPGFSSTNPGQSQTPPGGAGGQKTTAVRVAEARNAQAQQTAGLWAGKAE